MMRDGVAAESARERPRLYRLGELRIGDGLRRELARVVTSQTGPILLVGESGAGKQTVARCVAASYLCHEPEPDGSACGRCESCRLFASGNHFDVTSIIPEPGESIRVEDVRRRVSATLPEAPRLSEVRVYVISAATADTLNESCQNALLKPLEAHPPFSRFILMTEDTDYLLPTILSRVQTVRLGPRDDEAIRSVLHEAEVTEADAIDFAVRYAGGLPGVALMLAGDRRYRELLKEAGEIFMLLRTGSRTDLLIQGCRWAAAQKADIVPILRMWQSFVRELTVMKLTTEPSRHQLREPVLDPAVMTAWAAECEAADLRRAMSLLTETRRALMLNTHFEHTMARLFLQLRQRLRGDGDHREN